MSEFAAAAPAALPGLSSYLNPALPPFLSGPLGSRPQPGLEGFGFVKFCRNLVSVCKFGGFFLFVFKEDNYGNLEFYIRNNIDVIRAVLYQKCFSAWLEFSCLVYELWILFF